MDYSKFDLEAYIANHLKDAEARCPEIERSYGKDFSSFLFRADIDKVIRLEVISLLGVSAEVRDCLDNDHWKMRHPFNFPGPFYTGESDTCGTGDAEAPLNIIYDSYCCDISSGNPKPMLNWFA